MYSVQDFIERFREHENKDLIERLATADLTVEAKEAIRAVLRERGISEDKWEPLIKNAQKESFRKTRPGNKCDFCGNSIYFSAIKDEGQKFCSKQCLHNARMLELAIDIPDNLILDNAEAIRNGHCPVCNHQNSINEVRKYYWVWSAVYFTRWGSRNRISCKKCAVKKNFSSIMSSFLLGWWGVPWGIIITPSQIISNLVAILQKNKQEVSEELIQTAKILLAEKVHHSRINSAQQGAPADAKKRRG